MSSNSNRPISQNEERNLTTTPKNDVVGHRDLEQMYRVVQRILESQQQRRTKTAKAYDSKQQEFIEFCQKVYAGQPSDQIATVEHEKVYKFMWYQAYRCLRKQNKGTPAQRQGFDMTEYNALIEKYGQSNDEAKIDNPDNGIGISCMSQYKASILHLWKDQVGRGVNNRLEREVWQTSTESLMKMVKSRKQPIQKKDYPEKIDMETVERLRREMSAPEDPEDLTLHSVKATVVEYLNVLYQQGERNRHAIDECRNAIRVGFDSVTQQINALVLSMNQILELLQGTADCRTAMMVGLNAAKDHFQRMQHLDQGLPLHNTTATTTTTTTTGFPQRIFDSTNLQPKLPRQSEPSLLPRGFGHQLSHTFMSVMDLYNEWYGLERFQDVPVPGGIQAMDNAYKTEWRRSWSQAEQKYYSRVKSVITAMNKQIHENGRTLSEVSEEFEEAFTKHCKKKITNLVNWIDSNEYRRPKKRQALQLGD
ncbi:glycolytic enzyme transcriptional activator [Nitzschia inconspicua]|uniref:Glycolytic enzyme transcriptional activator n=1 Tax=Nitzschia inconspicua TaxID=303405 RepID=A0A9K3LJM3_9STRA|nr:glycolytic enzyme transcriptional activator [Nitzschia inconspicua]